MDVCKDHAQIPAAAAHGLVERMMDYLFKQNKSASAGEIAQALGEDVELIDLALKRRKEFVRTENDLWSAWS